MSEQTEEEYLIERLSKLLAEISVIVNGPQPMGVLWSYADLPQKVQGLKDAAAAPQPQVEPVAWGMPSSDGSIIDCITPDEHSRHEGGYTVPLYAAPQAQPQPRPQASAEDVAAALYEWMVGRLPNGDLLHASVVCDHAGAVAFKRELAERIRASLGVASE